jgi:hypothetical protein
MYLHHSFFALQVLLLEWFHNVSYDRNDSLDTFYLHFVFKIVPEHLEMASIPNLFLILSMAWSMEQHFGGVLKHINLVVPRPAL